jgi:hypothetical protein
MNVVSNMNVNALSRCWQRSMEAIMLSRQHPRVAYERDDLSDLNMQVIDEAFKAASEAACATELSVSDMMLLAANGMPEGASEFDRGIAVGMALAQILPNLNRE